MKKKVFMWLMLLLAGTGIAMAQTQVQGTIVDDTGEPAIGASIQVKGTTQGTVSDVNGRFSLSAPQNGTLVISYVGFKTQEVAVRPTLQIRLETDAEMLEDLVVIGYMQRKVAATSASVVKLDAKKIEEKPTANPFDALQGQVSGLQIFNSSGEPSAVSSIRLHGSGSLGASSAPLYLLDGVPVSSGTVQTMNPNDFESIQILKDAAATSIYGARAANGVIYITTKRGAMADKAKITVRGQYGISNLANTDYYNSMMNADELAAFWVEVGLVTQAQIDKYRQAYPHDTRWHEYFYKQDRPTYEADFSVSGGGKNMNYYVSGAYFSQEGLRYRSGYEKYSLRANLNGTVNDYVKFSLNNTISYDEAQSNPFAGNSVYGGLSSSILPFFSPYDKDGNEYYGELIPGTNIYSPRYLTDNSPYPQNTLNLNTSGNITITPFEGLTLRAQGGLELTDSRGTWQRNASYIPSRGNGGVRESFNRFANWISTNTATYTTTFNDDHSLTAVLGQEYIEYNQKNFTAEGYGLQSDLMMLLGSTTKDKQVGAGYSQYAFLSFFGQVSYDFKERYFVDLTVRNDASSRFGKNNKNAQFWSAGLLWKAKEEKFLAGAKWLNNLDVKLSYGTSGNAAIGNYASHALVSTSGQYQENAGWAITAPGNSNLTWEKQTKTTLGIKAGLFDRVTLDVELYNRLTSAMLMSVPYPYTSGFSRLTENVGEYLNRGVDLRLDLNFWKNKAGDYVNGYFTYNYNTDKVLSLFHGKDQWIIPNTGVCYKVGQPVMFYYPLFKQVNPDTGAPEWYVPGENTSVTTRDKVTSTFNLNALSQNTGIRRHTPVNGGWGIDAAWKGFYFQSYFAFSLGKHLISNDAYYFENPTVWGTTYDANQRKTVTDYWKKPGDRTKFPSLKYRFTEFDSRLIENASFMRMKTLTIGYNVPQQLLKKQRFLTGAKLYFSGRNLLTFTKFNGVDPEVDSNLTLGANPNTKQVVFGFEVSF